MIDERNYDHDLAVALSLDLCLEDENKSKSIASIAGSIIGGFRNDMIELGQKIPSAARKIAALILMPPDTKYSQQAQNSRLEIRSILTEPPGISLSFAAEILRSITVSMVKIVDEEAKKYG